MNGQRTTMSLQGAATAPSWSSGGERIEFGRLIGQGGEGAVFDVPSKPNLVAKVYTSTIPQDKLGKLMAMAMLGKQHPKLIDFCGWPVETLHSRTSGGATGGLTGLLMPKVSGRKEIHVLTGPSSRKKEFPDKGWDFQIHVARNLAAAVDVIHSAGCVIGDVNEKGFLVGPDGTLRVIDCDSFQIVSAGRTFRCEVGVPEYTPPELQSVSGGLGSVERTINHDAFGLATIIFRLLFQGRFPFSGRFSGSGEPDHQRFIKEYRFAFGRNAPSFQMTPPPHALLLSSLSSDISDLFERAFSQQSAGGGRPKAIEWHSSLGGLLSNLATCRTNQGHKYLKTLRECPWCNLEKGGGPVLFYGTLTHSGSGWTLNTSYFSTALARFQPINDASSVNPAVSVNGRPIPASVAGALRVAHIGRISVTIAVLGIGILIAVAAKTGWGVALGVVGALIAWAKTWTPTEATNLLRQREAELERLRAAHRLAIQEMEALPTAKYNQGIQSVRAKLEAYSRLDLERNQGLAELEQKKNAAQLYEYLDNFEIKDAKIEKIGRGRVSTLASWGINTAAEVTKAAISDVDGFGPTLQAYVLAWRRGLEAGFRYDKSKPVDPRELNTLMLKLNAKKTQLEGMLNSELSQLGQLQKFIEDRRHTVRSKTAESTRAVVQAEADLKIAKTFVEG